MMTNKEKKKGDSDGHYLNLADMKQETKSKKVGLCRTKSKIYFIKNKVFFPHIYHLQSKTNRIFIIFQLKD